MNGWNSYWLMDRVARGGGIQKVRAMMRTGSKMGLTVCRTWAFNDGGYNALQTHPGIFDERIFQVRASELTTGTSVQTRTEHVVRSGWIC